MNGVISKIAFFYENTSDKVKRLILKIHRKCLCNLTLFSIISLILMQLQNDI